MNWKPFEGQIKQSFVRVTKVVELPATKSSKSTWQIRKKISIKKTIDKRYIKQANKLRHNITYEEKWTNKQTNKKKKKTSKLQTDKQQTDKQQTDKQQTTTTNNKINKY